jgi:urease accessory protein UreE
MASVATVLYRALSLRLSPTNRFDFFERSEMMTIKCFWVSTTLSVIRKSCPQGRHVQIRLHQGRGLLEQGTNHPQVDFAHTT